MVQHTNVQPIDTPIREGENPKLLRLTLEEK